MPPDQSRVRGFLPSIVRYFLTSQMSIILALASLMVGAAAIMVTPREEEPQIVVPMADVLVQVPGASAEEVEKLVTTPLERLLWQIDGVEYVYSISSKDRTSVTVRFFVGENREDSLLKLYNTIMKNQDLAPSIVTGWVVKPVEIDDVPIVTLTLHADHGYEGRYSDFDLRRMAEELFHRLAEVEDVSRVRLYSGRSREVRVELHPDRMAGFHVSPGEIATALSGADRSLPAGHFVSGDADTPVVSESFLLSADDAASLVVGVFDDRPVYLRDVADILDGPAEPASYSRIGFSDLYLTEHDCEPENVSRPAVTIGLSKKKGVNAVGVADAVIKRARELERNVLPEGVTLTVTRDYGQTAHAKVNDLLSSLLFAIITVIALLAFTLGWREALVVALAVPMSFSLALFVNHLMGYTINRVTLFALILSLGLVVDDPITNVDNIQRHIRMGLRDPLEATLAAVKEVLPPVILSTLAIIVSFAPLFFITGMMGPYMAPMAANVPLTVSFSTVAALTVVPWMAYLLLRNHKFRKPAPKDDTSGGKTGTRLQRIYGAAITPFLSKSRNRWLLLTGILAGLGLCAGLVVMRLVPLKMLPFDNKNEFQILVDMPEGTTLERTDRAVRDFEAYLRTVPEVTDFVTYAGRPSPMDFNGMVRHYYWREQPNLADIRVNLKDKSERSMQSHAIGLRLRNDLQAIADRNFVRMKLVETPPGPPVIATLTAEVYGRPAMDYGSLIQGARHVESVMSALPGLVDLDDSSETDRTMYDFVLDKEKAALHGVTTADVVDALRLALSGSTPANVHLPNERQPLPVRLVLPVALRTGPDTLGELRMKTASGAMVPLAELGSFREVPAEQPIYHKNLRRVAYVYAETAGIPPGEAVLDLQSMLKKDPPQPGLTTEWAGEGEWKITLDVFRDLGIAFAAALIGIFILLVGQTGSFVMPALIMSAIPLTLLGILPGFWLLNLAVGSTVGGFGDPVFFTATSMIGMIALGGIVIRNSLVLIEFIQSEVKDGVPLKQAIVQSGAVRMRPIVLTALTTALGAWPITLDPIFSGLAWALIFGLVASTLFTLVVVPSGYYALYGGKERV
ncbi:Efflux pump membrane transporter BepE [Pseudodesulfovibrio hydrargyri]|uniref:Efflux pump membrane transporter BepE n=1 Tax=Pseudodesulfovibrio hydrargyri TaxID=2125990 RepID=A0A1J5MT15_9BACT|nr:efflux RND transporter permease subunit [Pseudodesulfovibrio hydrargyri]OIQ49757.1 Efflux pump membrane transporter BepE [Pseudodesulfovibrio hydrargyri]